MMNPLKRKEKTTLAVTATVSESTAGISLEEAEYSSNPTGAFSNKSKRQQNKSPDTSHSQAKLPHPLQHLD